MSTAGISARPLHWDGGHRDIAWDRTNVLILYHPGDAHSAWFAWDALSWELRWRYLNIEEPWRRTAIGFDSRDLIVDAWAGPSGDEWRLKDEDELAFMAECGLIDADALPLIRASCERAIERARRRDPPLDEDWTSWRPDAAWPIPTLPEGWNELEPRTR